MKIERLRIFISSPGDVAEERVLANNLVRRLSDEFEQQLRIEPDFWEHEPLLATSTFQKQIPPPRDCEVAVCILWSRIGTRLPADITRPDGSRYDSGTEYEFEDAALGFEQNGKPELLVYRKTTDPVVSLQDETALLRKLEQKKALDAFIQKWFFNPDQTIKAAFHPFATTAEFEQVLEEHLRKLIGRRLPLDGLATTSARPSWTAGSPFRGLQVFDFEHAPIFFGRTRAVGDLLTALRTNAAAGRAFVLVVGVSGGGKSSLVRAGLLPLLVQPGVVEGVGLWRRAVMRPADAGDPIRSLAAALLAADALPELAADGTTVAQLADSLRQNSAGAVGLVKGALSQAAALFAHDQALAQQPEARLVLVADQLEELFTLPNLAADDRKAFIAVLSALARGGKVWVIATLRGDFYHRCFELPELVALQEGTGQYALPLPTSAEIGQIIRQPARAAGLMFEEEPASKISLDEALREAASVSPESLPLLEFALEELYLRRTDRGVLTYAAYRELGGVEGALAQRAESVFASLTPGVQASFPRIMRALVSVGASDAVARQQAFVASVAPTLETKALVDAFVQARLFSADREHCDAGRTERGQPIVRVAHEALLRNWPRVVRWLEQDKELLKVRSRVSDAAARWIQEGRPADLLLGLGKPLDEAENLASIFGDELASTDLAFIQASRARQAMVAEQQKAVQASALVRRLIDADTAKVSAIIEEMADYRQWADPVLRQENGPATAASRQKLHTSLALLSVDAGHVDFLCGRLLTAEPNVVPVIRDALFPYKDALLDRLWSVAEKPEKGKEPSRLRAAAALVHYDPDSDKWMKCITGVARDLVQESPVFFAQWSEAFQPVKHHLFAPLAEIFRDAQLEHAAERNLATNLLAEYATDEPRVLSDLLMDADAKQFAMIFPKFREQAEGGLPVLLGEIDQKFSPDARDEAKERLAKRQANAAVALLRMNQPAKVWPLLRHSPDPQARSYLIHRSSPLGADPKAIIKQLGDESDLSIRRALILSLGEFAEQDLSPGERKLLTTKLQDLYRTAADPGLHAAAEWLLRTWKQEAWLQGTNDHLATYDNQRSRTFKALAGASARSQSSPSPQWYVNTQGQTMVAIPGPVEFLMGSPETEAKRQKDETQHKRRISRTFALAAKAVTFEQYRKYNADYDVGMEQYTRMPNLPVIGTNWYQAAAYCNWLSQEEGIAQDQWCYEITDEEVPKIQAGWADVAMRLRKDYLSLTGYRLPTEAELEYATRAGAITSRYYGETEDLLSKYAWYFKNSDEKTWPVGSKKPNDLGFFDVHGNVWCWCQESYKRYPDVKEGVAADDKEDGLNIVATNSRLLRGGSFNNHASLVRCAYRCGNVPSNRYNTFGFRAARTLPLVPLTSLPLPP